MPSPLASSAESTQAVLDDAREVLSTEARAIGQLADRLDLHFVKALDALLSCSGHVVVMGIGKSGFIAQNLSAILASTGIPSLYLHPTEAAHGDLGRVTRRDVVLALSNSGTTEELLRILPALRRIGARLIAITGAPHSPLARAAEHVLDIGDNDEAGPFGMVPTTSNAALHAICDALAITALKHRAFGTEEYALLHPGGALGRSLMLVGELMRTGEANPCLAETATIAEAVRVMTNTVGRPGAATLIDTEGRLAGIFTDGDLRRFIEHGHRDFSAQIASVMCRAPKTASPDEKVHEAAARMRANGLDQLPVVDAERRPVGLLDIQDLLSARFL
ncbi:MAG: KpsF/GutQ family sugar-phosphate isomerase [Myxococcales bacterium]|nr:KpsF/GutQ family sugar-phosphate isomerase [Myxococcales bacterium]